MLPTTLLPKTIRALNKLAHSLYGVDIHIPKEKRLERNKAIIERILPPSDRGRVTRPYAMRVSIAYEYARTHYKDEKHSLLSDIESGTNVNTVNLSKYKFRLEKR